MNITDFLFESTYQIITWVCIACTIGSIFYFFSKEDYRGVVWGVVGLICSVTIMVGMIAIRYIPHTKITVTSAPELKAAIHVEPGPINNFDVGFRTSITVKIRNNGPGTAYDVMSDVSIGILPYPFPSDYPFPLVAQQRRGKATLEPGAEGVGGGQFDSPLTKELADAVLDGTKRRLFLGGTISYRNSSGPQCTKRFLMSVGGPDFVTAGQTYKAQGSSNLVWEYTNNYNDVNKGCE
jgi:hypothetical protein